MYQSIHFVKMIADFDSLFMNFLACLRKCVAEGGSIYKRIRFSKTQ